MSNDIAIFQILMCTKDLVAGNLSRTPKSLKYSAAPSVKHSIERMNSSVCVSTFGAAIFNILNNIILSKYSL